MFDTHAHINFKRFKGREEEVIEQAHQEGVTHIVIPGTDLTSSIKALEIARKYENTYCAVGIHPHHVMDVENTTGSYTLTLSDLAELLKDTKTVAVGEIGMDRHEYTVTRHENYTVTEHFIDAQRKLLEAQISLAIEIGKSLILHNREAVNDLLSVLRTNWDMKLEHRTVFHCCEPDRRLLAFAQMHHIFIGVDGDVTYDAKKQEFIKEVPLDMLVVETDSPFILPEPLKSKRSYPNEPKNIPIIIQAIARIKKQPIATIVQATFENACRLFEVK